jgi:tetratricopeptide (TPR) repeat protein
VRKFAGFGLVLCISAIGLAQGPSPTPEADALFAKQDWASAAREFKAVTERQPADGRAWFRLGSALHRLARYEEARDAFRHAIENQFQGPYAMAGIAREYSAENDPGKALEWLAKSAKAGFAQPGFIDSDASFAALKSAPGYAAVRADIEKNAKPCLRNPQARQFDFWVGEWDVQVQGKIIANSSIQTIADGCIIQENWMPFGGTEGKSWNFYNGATGKWEQVWMSAGNVLKFEGEFKDGAMRYRGETPRRNGPPMQERLTFTPLDGKRVHQYWEQSTDGKTWTVAFDGIYVPKK